MSLVKARAMLLILQATCEQTLSAVEAVKGTLSPKLVSDLRTMIERCENELVALSERIRSGHSLESRPLRDR